MKIALMYSGQGSQYKGMGETFYNQSEYCKNFIDKHGLKQLLLENTYESTRDVQLAMVSLSVMINHYLHEFIKPAYVCGLSLGEYSALHFSQVFDDEKALEYAYQRGTYMEEAAKNHESKMVAVLKTDKTLIDEVCKQVSNELYVGISNYNCPGQVVISGDKQAVEQAEVLLKEKGAKRLVELKTSGPFHTPLLKEASVKLHELFKNETFHEMQTPVIFNTLGKEKENQTIPELLEKQVMSPVHFEETIQYLLKQGVDTFIEVGPGAVLSGFVKKTSKDVSIYHIEKYEDIEKVRGLIHE